MMRWIRHVLPFVTKTHVLVFDATGGRIGSMLPGMRFLLLEHVGRKTGLPRTTPILCIEDAGRFVVVASNAGQDHDPAWWLNLKSSPEAKVRYRRETIAVTARRADPLEANRLWPLLEASYRWFSEYREGTDRDIPIVILEPHEKRPRLEPFSDRVAVVTGAASGVGRALATELAIRGAHLALVDVDTEGLREVARELARYGVDVSTHVADVANASVMSALPREIHARHGHVHMLVNNAGVMVAGDFEDQSHDELRWLVGVNLWGVLHGCHYFLPFLRNEEEAKLVNVASCTAVVGFPGQSSYSATKAAVRGLSEALAAELAGTSVGVTSIYPGGIRTGLFAASRGSQSEEMGRVLDDAGTSRWFLTPEAVAKKTLEAVKKGKTRQLVGWDAYGVEALWRLSPRLAIRAIGAMRHRAGARTEGDAPGLRRVEATHRYRATPQQVWDVFTDHERWSEWAGTPGSKLLVEGEGDRNGTGAVRSFLGGVREQVLSFDPPKLMTYTVCGGPMPLADHEGQVFFESDGGETVVTWRCRFRSRVPGMGGVLEKVIARTFARALEGLEKHSFPRD